MGPMGPMVCALAISELFTVVITKTQFPTVAIHSLLLLLFDIHEFQQYELGLNYCWKWKIPNCNSNRKAI